MVEVHFLLMVVHFLAMDQEVCRKNLPNCIILDSWVFDSLILADKLLAKALRTSAET